MLLPVMEDVFGPEPWLCELPWLAEFALGRRDGSVPAASRSLVASVRRLGARRDLAMQCGCIEEPGIDMVHAAVNELLAQRALPQRASLSVAAPREGGLAASMVAGVVRACRAHGIELAVPLATVAATPQIGLGVYGAIESANAHVPAAGDLVLALRRRGPGDGDIEVLSTKAARLGLSLSSLLANGDGVARALVTPRGSHMSVLHDPLRQGWSFFACDIGDAPLVAKVRERLPVGLDVRWDFSAWNPPAPFAEWFPGADEQRAAASVCSAGCGMVVVTSPSDATKWLQWFAAWNEAATPIGTIGTCPAS